MTLLKQTLLALVVLVAGSVAVAVFVPAARPFAERAGLGPLLSRFGIAVEPVAVGASIRGAGGGPGGSDGAVQVVAAVPELRTADGQVISLGSARAIRAVPVTPEVTARILSLEAPSGSYVTAGRVIARLDDEAPRIALEKAHAVTENARATAERLTKLSASGATTATDLQQAELDLRTAELAERDAAFTLSRYTLTAPVSGWVGIWAADPGGQAVANSALTGIEDRSSLLVDFRVPERVATMIAVGQAVTASPLAASDISLPGTVSVIDNRVDEESRTLRVQARIDNQDGRYLPGMAFRIAVALPGEPHPAVDPLAIQWNSTGPYVWVVRDGKAEQRKVRILQRDADAVLVALELAAGDMVVSEGVQALRPGAAVEVVTLDPDGVVLPAAVDAADKGAKPPSDG